MSTRALRKAQKEAQIQKLADEAAALDATDDSEDDAPTVKVKPSAFAILNDVGDDDEDDEPEEDEKEDGKLPGDDSQSLPVDQSEPDVPRLPSKTRASKKKKKKNKTGTPSAANDEDVDALLERLANNAQLQKGVSGGDQTSQAENDSFCSLLTVDTTNLHVLNEMRRLFGRDAVEAERRENQQQAGAGRVHGRAQGQQAGSSRLAAIARKRNIFVQGKDDWPSAPSGGLGMEVVEKRENGIVEYRFVHSTSYQDTQRQFEIAVASMDPNRLVAMLHTNPYHVATLSQVSEIARHQGDPSGAGELLERALFSFGRSVHSSFSAKLSEGKARLDFRRPENREFALVIWRYIENLKLRATWRTVYEWAKLLFSMDPEDDPYCLTLVLDVYALRARQAQHLIDLSSASGFQRLLKSYGTPSPFCGFHASVALAHFQVNEHATAQERLKEVAKSTPWLFASLYRELQLEPIPPSIWGQTPPDTANELLTSIYITRSKDLWNAPEATSFLLSTLSSKALVPRNPETAETQATGVQECLREGPFIRHIILSEKPDWIGMLPDRPDQDQLRASDPVPPTDNLESYRVEIPETRVVDQHEARRILEQIQALALRGRRTGEGNRDGGDGDESDEGQDGDGRNGIGAFVEDVTDEED